jgi:hypothetical protein
MLHCPTGPAAEIILPEPKAKAAFLFTFPKYVEWPPSAFALPNDPLIVCIVGDEAIAREIREIARDKTIGGRPVKVHTEVAANIQKCHLLFIGASQKATVPTLLRALQTSPTLTVADFESFLDAGGMISLATKGTRIQFHVNLSSAQRANLALNAKLLALAESVRGKSAR